MTKLEMIGPYRIERELGRGGMGVVYLAHDTRLDRTVALKALPEEVAKDPERLSRFEREAKLLASLNHASIGAIYDVAESGGRRYLALEHIEGETLAQRLSNGALPVPEALDIALQIATGLEAAHERGVIHRDLKPGNIMITRGDQVKIVDFGLAKGATAPEPGAVDPPAGTSSSPTITSPAYPPGTIPGVILGTAPYLSPEQARGKAVDRRTDIWSWGCVLYECLTGRMAFQGETVSDTVAAILKQEPDWAALPGGLPPRVRELMRRCLEKDPRKRLRDIGEARLLLEEIRIGGPEHEAASIERGSRVNRGIVLASLLIVAAAAGAYWLARSSSRGRGESDIPLEASITLPPDLALDFNNGAVAISPDGKAVILEGQLAGDRQSQLWLRPMGQSEIQPIPGTTGASYPFWAPDSRSIGFFADQKLKRVSVAGGPVQTICDALDGRGATWNRNGIIVFSPAPVGGLYRVSAAGGKAAPLTEVKGTGSHRLPRFLPDGKRLLYFCDTPATRGIFTLDLLTRKSTLLLEGESDGVAVEPGYLFFLRDGNLLAQKLSLSTLRLKGDPIPVAADVPLSAPRHTGPYSVAGGTILYGRTDLYPLAHLTRFDSRGQAIDTIGDPAHYSLIRISPDGSRVAATLKRGSVFDLKVFDLNRRGDGGRTFQDVGYYFAWSPDGREIACGTHAFGQPADMTRLTIVSTTGNERRFIPTDGLVFPSYWASDGNLIYDCQSESTGDDIRICPLREPRKSRPLVATAASEGFGYLSPDGKWLLYLSDASGRGELYLTPFPGPGGTWQVSRNGSVGGVWLRHGIAYGTPDVQIVGMDVTFTGGQPHFGPPVLMFGGRHFRGGDITSDGKQAIASVLSGDVARSLMVVTNWRSLVEGK
jgi:Tol biopolymer transport system component/predicted Ser/Thr protein kinase